MAQMELLQALTEHLVSVTALTDLISRSADTDTPNIRPSNVPQGTELPYITIELLNDDDSQDLAGRTVYRTAVYKFNIVSDDALLNAQIDEVLRLNLNGYQQKFMPATKGIAEGAIWIGSTRRINGTGFTNSPQTGDQLIKKERPVVYEIGHSLPDNVSHPPITA